VDPTLEEKIRNAAANPKNLGEMKDAHAVGSAGSAGCGDLLRVWIKFREEHGQQVVDRASFQTFGCETAIAVASLATEMIQGKTVQAALAMRGDDFAAPMGPLPPMKVHCGALVEAAFRDALSQDLAAPAAPTPDPSRSPAAPMASLLDSLPGSRDPRQRRRIVLIAPEAPSPEG
jgi:NifU-like protein involved in Fe-S cluster formation